MTDYCAFSVNHKCLKWTDYQVTRQELEEADDLCPGNRIEIDISAGTLIYSEKTLSKGTN